MSILADDFDLVSELPDELLLLVLRFLGPVDLARAACACRRLAALSLDDDNWVEHVSVLLRLPLLQLTKPSWTTWREHWLRLALPPCGCVAIPPGSPLLEATPYNVLTLAGHLFLLKNDEVLKFESADLHEWRLVARKDLSSISKGFTDFDFDCGHLIPSVDQRLKVILDRDLNILSSIRSPTDGVYPQPLGGRILVTTDGSATLDWLQAGNRRVPAGVDLPGPVRIAVMATRTAVAYLWVDGVCSVFCTSTQPMAAVELHRRDADLRLVSSATVPIPPWNADDAARPHSFAFCSVTCVAERFLLVHRAQQLDGAVFQFDVISPDRGNATTSLDLRRRPLFYRRLEVWDSLMFAVFAAGARIELELHVHAYNSVGEHLWATCLTPEVGLTFGTLVSLPDAATLLIFGSGDAPPEVAAQDASSPAHHVRQVPFLLAR